MCKLNEYDLLIFGNVILCWYFLVPRNFAESFTVLLELEAAHQKGTSNNMGLWASMTWRDTHSLGGIPLP